MNQMSIFCVQIQPPVSVADDTHSPCFMFNAHVFLHASLYPVLAWGHASYKTISLSIAFNSFRSLESFPSFYPFLLFMLPFFSSPMESSSSHKQWLTQMMIIVCTCSVKINSVCITIPKTALTHNPFQISHQYKYQYFLHSHHLRQYNHHRRHQHGHGFVFGHGHGDHLKMFCCKPVGCLCEGKRWQSERIFIG